MKKVSIVTIIIALILSNITTIFSFQIHLQTLEIFRTISRTMITRMEREQGQPFSLKETTTWQGTRMEIVDRNGRVMEIQDEDGTPLDEIFVDNEPAYQLVANIAGLLILLFYVLKPDNFSRKKE